MIHYKASIVGIFISICDKKYKRTNYWTFTNLKNSEKRQEMRTNLIIFMIIKEEELKNWTASSQAGQHWQILDDWAVNFLWTYKKMTHWTRSQTKVDVYPWCISIIVSNWEITNHTISPSYIYICMYVYIYIYIWRLIQMGVPQNDGL